MLSSVASNSSKIAIIHAEGNIESNNSLASLNHIKILLFNASLRSGIVEVQLDLLQETWLTLGIWGVGGYFQIGSESTSHSWGKETLL